MKISRSKLRRLIESVMMEHVVSSETDELFHTVVSGDTLDGIGRKYDLSVQELKDLNGLTSDLIQIGQRLVVRTLGGTDLQGCPPVTPPEWWETETGQNRCPPCESTVQRPQWGHLPSFEWLSELPSGEGMTPMLDCNDSTRYSSEYEIAQCEEQNRANQAYFDSITGNVKSHVVSDVKNIMLDQIYASIMPETYVDIKIADEVANGELLSIIQGISSGRLIDAFERLVREKLESVSCELAFTITREDLEGLG